MKNQSLHYTKLESIQTLQEEKLVDLLKYLALKSPFYQRLFKENKVDLSNIVRVADLSKIPTTNKADLQNFNEDFLCVPKYKVVDFVNTSGTLGKPVNFFLTEKDLKRLAFNEFTALKIAGVNKQDIVQITTTIDRRFMAGMAYFLGARKIGAGVIRTGAGLPEMQWETILNLQPTVLVAVPSFVSKMIDFAEEKGIDFKNSSIKKLICVGENIRNQNFENNSLADRIQSRWDVQLFSTYASTEMGTSFTECEYSKGGHHIPELIIYELLDNDGNQVEQGQSGELTITTLGVEGMPLLRFRTGDICIAHVEQCGCGRTTSRLSPILGRKQQMIKLKGTTLYPQAIYNAINELPYIKNYVIECTTNDLGTDDILLHLGVDSQTSTSQEALKSHLKAKLRVIPCINFSSTEQIQKMQFPANSRKPVTFLDNRIK